MTIESQRGNVNVSRKLWNNPVPDLSVIEPPFLPWRRARNGYGRTDAVRKRCVALRTGVYEHGQRGWVLSERYCGLILWLPAVGRAGAGEATTRATATAALLLLLLLLPQLATTTTTRTTTTTTTMMIMIIIINALSHVVLFCLIFLSSSY